MSSWRLTTAETPLDAYMNLAIEEAIPRARSLDIVPNTIRLWRNANAVVLGYFDETMKAISLEKCNKLNVQIVRRFTGGGTVYHDLGNLNCAISFKGEKSLAIGNLEQFSRMLSEGILAGLRRLGVEAELEKLNAITISGKKLSGLARSFKWGVLFLHGCLLISTDIEKLSEVITVPMEKLHERGFSSIEESLTTVERLIGRKLTMNEALQAFKAGFEEALNMELVPKELTEDQLNLAKKLWREKYRQKDWNFKRPSEAKLNI